MASSDSWMKEYNEAVKLADDITGMISERSSFPASGPETQRHASAIRRKITILGTRLDSLQSLLSKVPAKWVFSSFLCWLRKVHAITAEHRGPGILWLLVIYSFRFEINVLKPPNLDYLFHMKLHDSYFKCFFVNDAQNWEGDESSKGHACKFEDKS